MNIYVVAPQHVAALWPKISKYIDDAIAEGWAELYTPWDVKKNLIDGVWLLWVAADDREAIKTAIVIRIADYPKCRVCEALLCGGDDMGSWLEPMTAAVEGFARTKGAKFMQFCGRPGWGRVFRAREQSRVFLRELS